MVPVLVCGLGNPGIRYQTTRHNYGFLTIDYFSDHFSFELNKKQFNCIYGETQLNDQRIIFIKPQTFMNLSGKAIHEFCHFYRIPAEKVIIVHDDIDLSFGDVRAKAKGGTAGHKGLISIQEQLGTDQFHRIRLGVGRPEDPKIDIADYVLMPFSDEELKSLPNHMEKATVILEKTLGLLK